MGGWRLEADADSSQRFVQFAIQSLEAGEEINAKYFANAWRNLAGILSYSLDFFLNHAKKLSSNFASSVH